MDYAAIIKDRVSTPELFAFYGFQRNRGGFINCPFHEEKTGSMKVYDGSQGYHCFGGCGAHGDIINFVQKLFRISFKDALAKINDDFHLGLPIGVSIDDEKYRHVMEEAALRRERADAFKKTRVRLQSAYESASSDWTRLDIQLRKYAPKTAEDSPDPMFMEALQKIGYAEYKLDCAETALYLFEKQKQ